MYEFITVYVKIKDKKVKVDKRMRMCIESIIN